jgi:hypothetical protein
VFRVSWEGGVPGPRELPPGEYAWLGYRLAKRATDGSQWYVSALFQKPSPVNVLAGEVTRMEVDPTVVVQKQLRPGGQIGIMVGGQGRSGLTVYKNGIRIPIGYRLVDVSGKALTSGKIAYG